MRVQYQLFLSVQQPKMKCCAATRDFEAVNHTGKVHYLLPTEHESMRRKKKKYARILDTMMVVSEDITTKADIQEIFSFHYKALLTYFQLEVNSLQSLSSTWTAIFLYPQSLR